MENEDFIEEIILDNEEIILENEDNEELEQDEQTEQRDNVTDTFQSEFDRIIREHVLDTFEEEEEIETGIEEAVIETDNNTHFDVAISTDAGNQLKSLPFENVEIQNFTASAIDVDDDIHTIGVSNSHKVVMSSDGTRDCDNAFSFSSNILYPVENEKKHGNLSLDEMKTSDLSQRSCGIKKVKTYNGKEKSYPETCDCLILTCPGCHFPCSNCESRFCGHECRIHRGWNYEEFEIQGRSGTRKRKFNN